MLFWWLKDGMLCSLKYTLNCGVTVFWEQLFKRPLDKQYYSYINNMCVCIILTNHKLQFLYLFCFLFSWSLRFSLSLPCLLLRLLSVPIVPHLSSLCSFYPHKHCRAHSGKGQDTAGHLELLWLVFDDGPLSLTSDILWGSQYELICCWSHLDVVIRCHVNAQWRNPASNDLCSGVTWNFMTRSLY